MQITRRTGLTYAFLALGGTALPRLAAAQTVAATTGPAAHRHTVDGGEVLIHPVDHASMLIETPGGNILVDPVGGAAAYAGLPQPQLILITHEHGDHFDLPTLESLPAVRIIANPAVWIKLPPEMQSRATQMHNGGAADVLGIRIEAIPAYNITEDRLQYHPKGRDNGYVLTIGGKRFLIAGDTEDTPELRALENIHAAFLPMNLPYTMTVQQAADAVGEFQPEIAYPYHHRGSDLAEFTRLVAEASPATQVVIANWYPAGE